jgi:hypothetical protein
VRRQEVAATSAFGLATFETSEIRPFAREGARGDESIELARASETFIGALRTDGSPVSLRWTRSASHIGT